jgi:hypothetical protein
MPKLTRPGGPLAAFVRHAERFGVECVYETAVEMNLGAGDLGCLARHLRRLDRRWRLSPSARLALAEGLVAAGARSRDVVEMAGVSHSTVAGLRAAGRGLAEPTRQPMEPCALSATGSGGSASESTPAQSVLFDAERAA